MRHRKRINRLNRRVVGVSKGLRQGDANHRSAYLNIDIGATKRAGADHLAIQRERVKSTTFGNLHYLGKCHVRRRLKHQHRQHTDHHEERCRGEPTSGEERCTTKRASDCPATIGFGVWFRPRSIGVNPTDRGILRSHRFKQAITPGTSRRGVFIVPVAKEPVEVVGTSRARGIGGAVNTEIEESMVHRDSSGA